MKTEFAAQLLTIYIGENDQFQGRPLYAAIVAKLKEARLAGVTVLHGIEGYGSGGHLHTERMLILFEGLPIVVQVVDTPEHITRALPLLDEMIVGGIVTVQDVQATRYTKS